MLEVSHLSRKYGDFLAVDDVSFSIQPGEIIGLLGHNGAGKTTIMKMLSGYLEPHQGTITIDGTDISQDPKKAQRMLGYLPESLPIYPEMSVADYLDYTAELRGLEGDFKQAEIRRVLEATDIRDKILAPIGTLSRGYKQRVGVAQAILGNPRFLILDEPTNGLDPTQTEQMRDLIRSLSRSATVIISTHVMQEVDALCGRVLIVKNGRLAIDEKLDELKISHEMEVSTSMPPDRAESLLGSLQGVKRLRSEPGSDASAGRESYSYRLIINDNAVMDNVAAEVARQVADNQARLYQLKPVVRNLETLFREVSGYAQRNEEEVSNVA